MIGPCPALAPPGDFLGSVMQFIDCQARTIGAQGYAALASPGSSFSIILTLLLSLFVALFGYRMLLGQTPSMREGVLAMVKIGLVLAFATSWPAYQTLFYDVAFEGPAELATDIGRPAGLLDGSSLGERLQLADRSMVQLAIAGTGEGMLTPAQRSAQNLAPPPFGGFDAFALGMGRAFYLTGAVGAFGAVRLIAGLLLALGPFFLAFLLFDGTRGLFEGWLRVLVGAAIGALGTTVILAVELALLEPRLADWLGRRAAGLPAPGAAVELLAISLIFTVFLLAVLIGSARVARGFRLPPFRQLLPAARGSLARGDEVRVHATTRERAAAPEEGRRAAEVADAVAATQRREAARATVIAAAAGRTPMTAGLASGRDLPAAAPVPIGQSFRRTRTRVSASSGRRDRRP